MDAKWDITGQRFGRLLVIGYAGKDSRRNTKWLCRCDCGCEKVLLRLTLVSGATRSCTCLQKEMFGQHRIIHGQSRKTTYRIWDGMRRRCQDPNNPGYKHYGYKGITVCEKWQKFKGFFEDMGARPPGLTIERKDSRGNYEKTNCIWATPTENLRNRCCVKLNMEKAGEIRALLAKGDLSQKAIAKIYKIDPSVISDIHTEKAWV